MRVLMQTMGEAYQLGILPALRPRNIPLQQQPDLMRTMSWQKPVSSGLCTTIMRVCQHPSILIQNS